MATKNENIVPMPAISRPGSEAAEAMARELYERERKYQAAMAIARAMLRQGILDEADFNKTEAFLRDKFSPFIGTFQG